METKLCRLCNQLKPATFEHFYKVKDRPSGMGSQCRDCLHSRRRSLGFKVQNREYKREKYASDPEYRQRALDGMKRRLKKPRARELRKVFLDKWRGSIIGRAHQLLSSARARSAQKGLECTITREWIVERLEAGKCEATDLPFDFSINERGPSGKQQAKPLAPSIDRIDPKKGYIIGNVRIVAWAFNLAIGNWGEEAYGQIARAWLLKNDNNSQRLSSTCQDGSKVEGRSFARAMGEASS